MTSLRRKRIKWQRWFAKDPQRYGRKISEQFVKIYGPVVERVCWHMSSIPPLINSNGFIGNVIYNPIPYKEPSEST